MNEFDFTLRFILPATASDPECYLEALAAGGCDDALVGIGQMGRIALNFSRAGSSATEAVVSAITDVQRAIPGARLFEAAPDLVGLTDIAIIIGCSRQNMRKIMINAGPSFPAPVHEGKLAMWHLATVLTWLQDSKSLHVDARVLEVSRATRQLNIEREYQQAGLADQPELRSYCFG